MAVSFDPVVWPDDADDVVAFLTANDWPFGAALGMTLIAIMIALLLLQARATAHASGERGGRGDA